MGRGGGGGASQIRDKLKTKKLLDAPSLPITESIIISYEPSQPFWHFTFNQTKNEYKIFTIKYKVPKRLRRFIRNYNTFFNRE